MGTRLKVQTVLPDDVQNKIKLIVLLKHNYLGCHVSVLHDDYQRFTGETLLPQTWGYNSMKDMLKKGMHPSMLEFRKERGADVVHANVTDSDAMLYFRTLVEALQEPKKPDKETSTATTMQQEPCISVPTVDQIESLFDGIIQLPPPVAVDERQERVSSSSTENVAVDQVEKNTFEKIQVESELVKLEPADSTCQSPVHIGHTEPEERQERNNAGSASENVLAKENQSTKIALVDLGSDDEIEILEVNPPKRPNLEIRLKLPSPSVSPALAGASVTAPVPVDTARLRGGHNPSTSDAVKESISAHITVPTPAVSPLTNIPDVKAEVLRRESPLDLSANHVSDALPREGRDELFSGTATEFCFTGNGRSESQQHGIPTQLTVSAENMPTANRILVKTEMESSVLNQNVNLDSANVVRGPALQENLNGDSMKYFLTSSIHSETVMTKAEFKIEESNWLEEVSSDSPEEETQFREYDDANLVQAAEQHKTLPVRFEKIKVEAAAERDGTSISKTNHNAQNTHANAVEQSIELNSEVSGETVNDSHGRLDVAENTHSFVDPENLDNHVDGRNTDAAEPTAVREMTDNEEGVDPTSEENMSTLSPAVSNKDVEELTSSIAGAGSPSETPRKRKRTPSGHRQQREVDHDESNPGSSSSSAISPLAKKHKVAEVDNRGSQTTVLTPIPMPETQTENIWFVGEDFRTMDWKYEIIPGFIDSEHVPLSFYTYMDPSACNPYITLSLEQLQDLQVIWSSKDEDILRFHPFGMWAQQASIQIPTSFTLHLSFLSLQLLNLDADLNLQLTESSGSANSRLTFVSSYGSFEDYFLWQKRDDCLGFGLMLPKMSSQAPGIDYSNYVQLPGQTMDNMDILDPVTQRSFIDLVHSNIDMKKGGVDVFVANAVGLPPNSVHRPQDVGMAQCLLALKVLREGGIFVLKLEDTITCFGVGLIFLLSRCFIQITICQPISCLPGERFLVCRWKRPGDEVVQIKRFLVDCCKYVSEQAPNSKLSGIIERFFGFAHSSMYLEVNDPELLEYVRGRNKLMGKQELKDWEHFINQSKINGMMRTVDILSSLKTSRKKLVESWIEKFPGIASATTSKNEIDSSASSQPPQSTNQPSTSQALFNGERPNETSPNRTGPNTKSRDESVPDRSWNQRFKEWPPTSGLLKRGEKSVMLAAGVYRPPVGALSQWQFVFSSGAVNRTIVLACEGGVYRYRLKDKSWIIVENLDLLAGTVLYAEFIDKCKPKYVLNIIDAAFIANKDIRDMDFGTRRAECLKFATDMDFPVNEDYRIICSDVCQLEQLPEKFLSLERDGGKLRIEDSSNSFIETVSNRPGVTSSDLVEFQPHEVLLLKTASAHSNNGEPDMDFKSVNNHRYFWEWNPRTNLTTLANAILEKFVPDDATPSFELMKEEAKA